MGKVAEKLAAKALAKKKAQAEDKARLKAGGGYSPEPTDEDKSPPEELAIVDTSGEDGPESPE